MKLIDQITRRQLFLVAFGTSQQSGGLTSVDLAATRDESQVVLTASDGSAAPITGAEATVAGVMTAADKAALDDLSQGSFRVFAARAEIPSATIGAAITHLRTAGYAAAGDGGGAIYARAGSEPAHALKVQSADGAWWELVPDSVGISVRQAGAAGDGTTDDSQAFIDAVNGVDDINPASTSTATHPVIVPPGHYYMGSTTLELKRVVTIMGFGLGLDVRPKPAKLSWDANVTGIIVHQTDTIGAGREASATGGAGGSIISGLELVGGGGSIASVTDDTKGHGIWLRAHAKVESCWIHGFAGNGLQVVASLSGGDDIYGNANLWKAADLRTTNNHKNGIYVKGADANAGYCIGLDSSNNGRWGVHDGSFLGNTYIALHESTSGLANQGGNGADESSKVHYNDGTDRRYAANVNATEAELVATTPGTDESVWIDVGSGASTSQIPTWQSGQPEGTYFHGGSYHTDNANARNLFSNCYVEGTEGPPQFVRPTMVFGGKGMQSVRGTWGGLIAEATRTLMAPHTYFAQEDASRDLKVSFTPSQDAAIGFNAEGDHSFGLTFSWEEDEGTWAFVHSNIRPAIRFTTDLTTRSFGRGAAIGDGYPWFNQGMILGKESLGRHFAMDTGLPGSGDNARGDIRFDYAPNHTGAVFGYRCITSGNPGTWHEYFVLPDLPGDHPGYTVRPKEDGQNRVEWREAAKAGTATIADTASTQAVSFATAFADADYAVAVSADGDERVWVTGKTASGFTLNRAGATNARNVDWTATPREDL